MQTGEPVVQDMVPVWQGLVGVHTPVAQLAQAPLSQTLPAAQDVPLAEALAVPVSVHTGDPVPHAIVPVSQMFAGGLVQGIPVVHATHDPLSHTPEAQEAPLAAG